MSVGCNRGRFHRTGWLSAEFGVIMPLYLKQSLEHRLTAGQPANEGTLRPAIREGAVRRVRPKTMTVAVTLAGLFPIMLSHDTGSGIMQRIAAPMVGGMATAPLLSMLVVSVVYRPLRGPVLGVCDFATNMVHPPVESAAVSCRSMAANFS